MTQQATVRRPNVFGMITTRASREYTPVALRSFFAHTPFGADDRFVLIDNDADFVMPEGLPANRITVVRPAQPQGFAVNANICLAEAKQHRADLYLLNNDLVFSTGWLEPLLADRRALLSPISNGQVTRAADGWTTRPAMDLIDYAGHEAAVETIALQQRTECSGYRPVLSVAFFCIKIPRLVYEEVGTFDERFGKGGAEDRDYAIRAWRLGIPQEYALASYVFHFQGKSTWRGAETQQQIAARNAHYTDAFQKKWGAALTYAFIGGDWNLFRSDPQIARLLDAGNFKAVVARLRQERTIDRYIRRQQNAKFAAVCCIYDDDSWLALAMESIYDACDSIWFLVGTRPWNGEPTDQQPLLDRIAALPDPTGKMRIVRGDWPDEATQRNDGIRMLREAGIDYCMVVDADEIYDPAQLQSAMTLVRQNPQIDCWRSTCFTYWKSFRYRVDPPEQYPLQVFVRVGTGRFTENRMYESPQEVAFDPDALRFHHMSYARTDAQILRKITTFGHAREVVPGWYESVWRKWDTDHSLRNLNPCWPAAYQRIVEQPYTALPRSLQTLRDREERAA